MSCDKKKKKKLKFFADCKKIPKEPPLTKIYWTKLHNKNL